MANQELQQQEFMNQLYEAARETSRKQMQVLEGAGQKTDRTVNFSIFKQNSGGFPLEDATLTLDGITRRFSIFVLAADQYTRKLNLRLEIKTTEDDQGNGGMEVAEFQVGHFEFPMIDNTRLSHNQCAAVVLNDFGDDSADITLAYFLGCYASLKEQTYYAQVIQHLLDEESMEPAPSRPNNPN